MAPDPSRPTVATGNPFPALSEYTKTHTSGKDALKFEPEAALGVAAAAESTIAALKTLQLYTEDLTAGAPVSNLASGTALGNKFGTEATDLHTVFEDHKKILGQMIDTFIQAGKAYGKVEGFNSELLDNVSSKPDYMWEADGLDPIGDPPKVPPPAKTDDKTPVDAMGNEAGLHSFQPTTISPEAPDYMSWFDLYQVGNHIRYNKVAENLADHAGTWWWMSTEVNKVYSDLLNTIDSVTADKWSGPGKETAVAAVQAYGKSIPALSKSIEGTGDLLLYSSGWLNETQYCMPPNNEADEETKQSWLQYTREMFRKTYVYGMNQSATHVPVIPAAASAFGALPANPFDPTGTTPPGEEKPNGNDDPGGKHPGGSNPGGTDPGGTNPGGAHPGASTPGGSSPGAGALSDQQNKAAQDHAVRQQRAALAEQQHQAAAYAKQQQSDQREQQRYQQQQQRQQQQYQQQQQVAAQQQQEQQQVLSAVQQLMSAAQQGAQQLMQACQQIGQTLTQQQQQDVLSKAGLGDIPGLGEGKDPLSALMGAGGGAGGGGLPGGNSAGVPGAPALNRDLAQASKLFPRASALGTASGPGLVDSPAGRAGAAPMAGTPGSPGAAGAGAQNQQGREHKRPAYLDSVEYLEDALGEAPVVVKPVVEK